MGRRIFIFEQLPAGPANNGEWVQTGATGFERKARTHSFQQVHEEGLFRTAAEPRYRLIEARQGWLVSLLLKWIGDGDRKG